MKIFSWKRGHEEKKKLSNTTVSNWNKHCLKTQAKVAVAAGTFCEFVSWDELWMWLMRAKRDLFVRGVKKKFSTVKCFKETVKDSTTSRPGRLMFSTTASCALPISWIMFAEGGSTLAQRADDERAAVETWTLKRGTGGWS